MNIYNKSKNLSVKYFNYFNLLNLEYEESNSKLLKLTKKNPSTNKYSRQISDINDIQISKKLKGNLSDQNLYQIFNNKERNLIIKLINLTNRLK